MCMVTSLDVVSLPARLGEPGRCGGGVVGRGGDALRGDLRALGDATFRVTGLPRNALWATPPSALRASHASRIARSFAAAPDLSAPATRGASRCAPVSPEGIDVPPGAEPSAITSAPAAKILRTPIRSSLARPRRRSWRLA